MIKILIIIMIVLVPDMALSSGGYSHKRSLINQVSIKERPLCIGDNETRYFIRLNKKENTDSLLNYLKKIILMNGDSIIRFYSYELSESKNIRCMYEDRKFFGLIGQSFNVHVLYNEKLQVLGIWTYRYTGSRVRSKSLNIISRRIYKKILKRYPLGEYIGKQKLSCLTKANNDRLFKRIFIIREKEFWDWFSSKGQHLLDTDLDRYFPFVYDALRSVSQYLNCTIDKEVNEKVITITGHRNAIDRLKKYKPDKLNWEIKYEIK